MKTHLVRPGEWLTMCGIDFPEGKRGENTTNVPYEVDCKTCVKFYQGNVSWWWIGEFGLDPIGAHYSHIDYGFPNLFLTLLKG